MFTQLVFFCLYKCTRTSAKVVRFWFEKFPTAMRMEVSRSLEAGQKDC